MIVKDTKLGTTLLILYVSYFGKPRVSKYWVEMIFQKKEYWYTSYVNSKTVKQQQPTTTGFDFEK